MGDIIVRARLAEIVSARDAAIAKMDEALGLRCIAHGLAQEAGALLEVACRGARFHQVDRTKSARFGALFDAVDRDAMRALWREHVDASVWTHIADETGMTRLMDTTAKEEFWASLAASVPEVTEQAVLDTVASIVEQGPLTFARGVARVFCELSREFKSHDPFLFGRRIILTNVLSDMGRYVTFRKRAVMDDVERALHVLAGTKPEDHPRLADLIGNRGREDVVETPHLRVRVFKNNNAHLWFKDRELVARLNQTLALYYGEVLPDAAPRGRARGKRATTTELSKDLAFYPTPPAVVKRVLDEARHIGHGLTVLEPSAGEGAFVGPLLDAGHEVWAVEVDAGRADRLRAMSRRGRLTVVEGNFLDLDFNRQFPAIVMNPPFYGTHWIAHVRRAFDLLAPGGSLYAVLPATADVGVSAEHEAFRTWAREVTGGYARFGDLPPESFASSGTRINTVLLTMEKREHGR